MGIQAEQQNKRHSRVYESKKGIYILFVFRLQ